MVRFTGVCRSVDFTKKGTSRVVTLNRPKAMNALNHQMVKEMRPKLNQWASEADFGCLVVRGAGGKALCAGGDIKDLTLPTYEGDYSGTFFFREEYQLDYQIATYPRPVVALMHGVVMGGGVGLSVHAPVRVGTEKTLFAMPETGIGLFPDVGAGHFLPRVKHPGLGMFLGLTGQRLKGGDNLHAGTVTHFVPSDKLPELEDSLSALPNGASVMVDEVKQVVGSFETPAGKFALANQLAKIESHFANKENIYQIISELESADGCEWAAKTAKTLRRMSPMSLAITHEQIKRGENLDLAGVFGMEYNLAYSCLRHEFAEGVRALLIDRDNAPKWRPDKIESVTQGMVDEFFEQKPHAWHPTE